MSEFSESLQAQANAKRSELEELHREREAIEVRLEAAVRYLEKLNPLLVVEGGTAVNIKAAIGQQTGFAAPGNRSSKMPRRRPEFESLPLVQIVERVLAPGNPMHANDVVKEIYEITTTEEMKRANPIEITDLAMLVDVLRPASLSDLPSVGFSIPTQMFCARFLRKSYTPNLHKVIFAN